MFHVGSIIQKRVSLQSVETDLSHLKSSQSSQVNLYLYTENSLLRVRIYETFYLKAELRILEFNHFRWLAGHRLSVHIPAVPNMVKERVSNKAS